MFSRYCRILHTLLQTVSLTFLSCTSNTTLFTLASFNAARGVSRDSHIASPTHRNQVAIARSYKSRCPHPRSTGLESPLSTVTDVVLSPNEKHSESLCDIMEERDELQDTSLPLHTPSRDSITHSSPLYSDVQHIYDPRLDIVLTSLLQLVKSHLNQK